MGFLSRNCERCEHPLLSSYATNDVNAWMEQAVAVYPDGTVVTGAYDGYGRIEYQEDTIDGATVWHEACWKAAGSPSDFRGESGYAEDQGYFFDEGTHDLPEPPSPDTSTREADR